MTKLRGEKRGRLQKYPNRERVAESSNWIARDRPLGEKWGTVQTIGKSCDDIMIPTGGWMRSSALLRKAGKG